MTKRFYVGDKVTPKFDGMYSKVGRTYTVETFTMGGMMRLAELKGILFNPEAFVYAASAAPSFQADKEAAKLGGLQAHSIGGLYPLAVVGYGMGDTTKFVIENLTTGEVLTCASPKVLRSFDTVGLANKFITDHIIGNTPVVWGVGWVKGRPVYTVAGSLVMPTTRPEQRKVHTVSVPDGADPITWYYLHLEQDIG